MPDIHNDSPVVTSMTEYRHRASDHGSPYPLAPASLDELPLMLTVGEAAAVLRISRTTAYKLIEDHRATGGRTGLTHVRLGSRIMVRRVDLARIVGDDQPA